MKYKSIYLLACAFMIIAFASCKKDLLKVNTNPTGVSPSNYDPNFTLSEVQMMYTGSTDYASEVWQTEWGNIGGYIQHTASVNTSFYSGDKYLFSPVNVGQYFFEAYQQQVEPVVDLLHLTANNPKLNNVHQMARIMRALVFQRLTDMYGDVPYFQAGLGYYDRIYTPVYDKQQDIYTDMLKEVSQAVDSLDVNGDIATGDLYYYTTTTNAASQVAQWKKFGNSLILRLAMRLTKVDPATAQSWVTKVANSCMQSNADDAIVQHNLSANTASENRDAWVILTQDSTDLNLCSTFVNMLRNDKDPRLNVFSYIFRTDDTTAAAQNGLPPGFIVGNGKTTLFDITTDSTYNKSLGMEGYSRPSPYVLNVGAPSMIISYAQTELLLADASVRWGIGGDASVHYVNGITAGVTEAAALYGAPAPTAAQINYLTNIGPTAYGNDPSSNTLNQINTQYWITCFMDEYEAWANWRRTSTVTSVLGVKGSPSLTPTDYTGNITNGTIPRRLTYPSSEALSNGANLAVAVAREKGGKDVQTNRVWWDTQ